MNALAGPEHVGEFFRAAGEGQFLRQFPHSLLDLFHLARCERFQVALVKAFIQNVAIGLDQITEAENGRVGAAGCDYTWALMGREWALVGLR